MLRALRAQRADEAAVAAFERRCVRLGRAHLRAAQGAVASPAWQRLWLELGRLLVDGHWHAGACGAGLPVAAFAASLLQQRAADAEKARQTLCSELDAAGRHRLRIAAKKLRYAAEFFAALFPKTARAALRRSRWPRCRRCSAA